MIYQVIVDISNSQVDKVFDYYCRNEIEIGSRVLVPFGSMTVEGFVINKVENSENELKDIIKVLDDYTALTEEMICLSKWMAYKYHLRLIDCLRLAVPSQLRNSRVKPLVKKLARLTEDIPADEMIARTKPNATMQQELIEYLRTEGECYVDLLNNYFGSSAVKTLTTKGFINIETIKVLRTPYNKLEETINSAKVLTPRQQAIIDEINSNLSGTYLIHGVTGSGKTEVYMTIIEKIANSGKSAIMLVPEISLTPSVLRQFRSRFGTKVAILHSGLSDGEKYDEWRRLFDGSATIAIGARSAVFAPLKNIGVIIIDEEHDSSYVAYSNPRYTTIEVAQFRAEYNKCCLIMGSATPNIDSYTKAIQGEYKLLTMPERINKRSLPEVEIVDMALELRMGNKSIFSNRLIEQLTQVINDKNQAMLFLNRRGYSSFVMCNKCGYVAKCTDCEVSLTYHQENNQLQCHYCNKKFHMFDFCPNCKSQYIRQGKIGTEQIVKMLNKMFPDVNVLRMDYDTTRNKGELVNILQQFSQSKAQILVGTQMIAKGHDFPGVTLVGILDADQGLFQTDYKSSENTFQLLTQVAGRSGRQDLVGKVILQTYSPQHYVLQYAAKQDYLGFYNREANIREATKFPPYATLLRILYASISSEDCILQLNAHYEKIVLIMQKYSESFLFISKMKSPLSRLEKKFRYQILLRLANNEHLSDIIQEIYLVSDIRVRKECTVFVEINPLNLS